MPKVSWSTRQTTLMELPLAPGFEIQRPEQVVLKIGTSSHDFGAYCYAVRSSKVRNGRAGRDVDLTTFLPTRVIEIRRLIEVFSRLYSDGGFRFITINNYANSMKRFLEWADAAGFHDCLSGDLSTTTAYRTFVSNVEDRYRRHEFEAAAARHMQKRTRFILEALTGLNDLGLGLRFIQDTSWRKSSTAPAGEADFADVIALNEAIFSGFCELTLDQKPFPYKLLVPKSLGWEVSSLWTFPTTTWCLPPHLRGDENQRPSLNAGLAYDFERGNVLGVEEIWMRYSGKNNAKRREVAREAVARAIAIQNAANTDFQHRMRRRLGFHALNSFFFLFIANTGANLAVARNIETSGMVDDHTSNQRFRVLKFRAQLKEISVTVPVAFMPSLRRYFELRRFLLGEFESSYLFFGMGNTHECPPEMMRSGALDTHYTNLLLHLHPKLPRIKGRQVRATVSDFFQRNHDAAVSARLMGHTEEVANRNYLAGSPVDHFEDMSSFLSKVSEKAKVQLVVKDGISCPEARELADGGTCASYGRPEPFTANVPLQPDCRTGCLFCANRVLAANEADARKVASAAYLMEQLIRGPESETEFRPQINKCDADLEQIAAFESCREMVNNVRHDVYQNGNLSQYYADKYHLFLELGVL